MSPRLRLLLTVPAVIVVGSIALSMYSASLPDLPPTTLAPQRWGALPRPLSVCWVEFSHGDIFGQFGTAGLTRASKWRTTASGILVRHPKGDVLIDSGYSSVADEEAKDTPLLRRQVKKNALRAHGTRTLAPEALRRAGVEPAALRWFIPSHAHDDHVGGLIDLPRSIPILLPREELEFVTHRDESSPVVPAHAQAMLGRMTPIPFEHKPYETFQESYDVFGDGTVVLALLGGHTPGSIATFVTLSPTQRLVHVGDVLSLEESLDRKVPKSGLIQYVTDTDHPGAKLAVARLVQLHELDPKLQVIPAHDRTAYERFFGKEPGCVSVATAP